MSEGIEGELARVYDVFVDWPGRLGREMPGLLARLRASNAHKVLDAGCGTGRHLEALRKEGFDAHGADCSDDMLSQARALLGGADGLHAWRLGDAPPAGLRAAAPFDAVVCLGNVWPQLIDLADARAACAAFLDLLRPGGLVLMGLKAVAVRRESGDPYLPLLRRERDGVSWFFVRFVAFDAGGDSELCDFHMLVARGDAGGDTLPPLHRASRMRVWDAPGLERFLDSAGLADVRVSGSLDDPAAPPATEDVFVHARAPV